MSIVNVTQEDLQQGNFEVFMENGKRGWIGDDEIILPGNEKPLSSKLEDVKCQLGSRLVFRYTDWNNFTSLASPNSKVATIVKHPID